MKTATFRCSMDARLFRASLAFSWRQGDNVVTRFASNSCVKLYSPTLPIRVLLLTSCRATRARDEYKRAVVAVQYSTVEVAGRDACDAFATLDRPSCECIVTP